MLMSTTIKDEVAHVLSGVKMSNFTPYADVKRDGAVCKVCNKGSRGHPPLTVPCITRTSVLPRDRIDVCLDCVIAHNARARANSAAIAASLVCEASKAKAATQAASKAKAEAWAAAVTARNASIEARNHYYARNFFQTEEHRNIIRDALSNQTQKYVFPAHDKTCDVCNTEGLNAAMQYLSRGKKVMCVCFSCILESGFIIQSAPTASPFPAHRKTPLQLLRFMADKNIKPTYTRDKLLVKKPCSNCFYLNNFFLRLTSADGEYRLCVQCSVDFFRKYRELPTSRR